MQLCSIKDQKKANSIAILPPNFIDLEHSSPVAQKVEVSYDKENLKLKTEFAGNKRRKSTKIITPKKSSTIKKRSLTSSISGLRKQFNEIEEKVHKDEQELINSNQNFQADY